MATPHWEHLSKNNPFLWVCAECPDCSNGCLKKSVSRPTKCYKEENDCMVTLRMESIKRRPKDAIDLFLL